MSVHVRPGAEADLPDLTELYNGYVRHTAVTFDTEPCTVEQRRDSWFVQYADTGPHRLLVAEQQGAVVGYATSSTLRVKPAYSTSVETTIYLVPEATGHGVGRMLYGSLLGVLRGEGLHRAYAGVALPNDASVALHHRLGFTDVGVFGEVGFKLGRYRDVLWLELDLTLPKERLARADRHDHLVI